jgi:hypothetical protein
LVNIPQEGNAVEPAQHENVAEKENEILLGGSKAPKREANPK